MKPPAASDYPTVLVVDDFVEIRVILGRLLQAAGYRILEASGARQAQRLADEDGNIDVLVTDFRMPDMNGVELAGWFHSRFPATKVVVLSGSACELEAYDELADWALCLDKSKASAQLVGLVKRLLAEPRSEARGLGGAEIDQSASAETRVLAEIPKPGHHSRRRI
jgi:DNA-binding NtrC family response regulator